MAYERKTYKKQEPKKEREWVALLENNDDVAVTVFHTERGGYGTLRSGPVDITFTIFEGDNGYYPLFPSYKKKDGTYKKLVFVSGEVYNALTDYINQ